VNDLALFPLGTVLFPGGLLPLRLDEQRYLEMGKACLRDAAPFGVCRIREGVEVGAPATPEPAASRASSMGHAAARRTADRRTGLAALPDLDVAAADGLAAPPSNCCRTRLTRRYPSTLPRRQLLGRIAPARQTPIRPAFPIRSAPVGARRRSPTVGSAEQRCSNWMDYRASKP
jgi:hypothetical protein